VKTYIYPYKSGSASVRALRESLGIKKIKTARSRFRGSMNKQVINWGCGSLPDQVNACHVINKPQAVNIAGNKLLSFKELAKDERIHIPEFTTDKVCAEGWINDDKTVVARTILRGHSGSGISIASTIDDLVDAPLYVQYIKKTHEYRVHILNGQVIDQQRKARSSDVPDEEVNWQVRNHSNGFIFMREGVDLVDAGLDQAKFAIEALGLDFGAVDLIYNQRQDKFYVLEVNTAPGLTGTTLERYTEAFNELL